MRSCGRLSRCACRGWGSRRVRRLRDAAVRTLWWGSFSSRVSVSAGSGVEARAVGMSRRWQPVQWPAISRHAAVWHTKRSVVTNSHSSKAVGVDGFSTTLQRVSGSPCWAR